MPPPLTAAARAPRPRPNDRLTHICKTHLHWTQISACRANLGCVSYCGLDLTGEQYVDTAPGPDDCIVCEDLASP